MVSRNGKLVTRDAESFLRFLGLNANATIDDILKIQNLDLGEFDGDERETFKVLS